MRHARAAVVRADVELLEPQVRHHADAIFRHGAFRIQLVVVVVLIVIAGGFGFGRGAIAPQIDGDDGEGGGELRGNAVPDVVALGEAVEEEEGGAGTGVEAVDVEGGLGVGVEGDGNGDGDGEGGEVFEHLVCRKGLFGLLYHIVFHR